MQTQVSKWGNSLAVRIPKAHAEHLGLSEGMAVEMVAERGAIIITKASYHLDTLLRGVTPDNLHGETDWGDATGREEW